MTIFYSKLTHKLVNKTHIATVGFKALLKSTYMGIPVWSQNCPITAPLCLQDIDRQQGLIFSPSSNST